jgi:peptidoglycan/xylan/chitin deacetylase (PgdA/CDA1 family)
MTGMSHDHGRARRVLTAGVALGAVHALPALAKPLPAVGSLLGVESAASNGVALTFDDGPHPEGTPEVLELLRRRRVAATFFLVGEQIERCPGLAAEVVAAGHTVGVHCHRHRNLLRLTPGQVRDDLDRALDLIARVASPERAWHRPPYGVYSWAALREVRRRELRPLLWTHWGRDWRARATAESIAAEATTGLRRGSVVLLHDADTYSSPGSWRRTVAALPHLLDRVEASGLVLSKL